MAGDLREAEATIYFLKGRNNFEIEGSIPAAPEQKHIPQRKADPFENYAIAQFRRGEKLVRWERAEFMRPTLEKYEAEGNPYYSTARLWDDGIIDPADSRALLALGIAASANAPIPPTKFGVFRL